MFSVLDLKGMGGGVWAEASLRSGKSREEAKARGGVLNPSSRDTRWALSNGFEASSLRAYVFVYRRTKDQAGMFL
jgi:hypothetical protein